MDLPLLKLIHLYWSTYPYCSAFVCLTTPIFRISFFVPTESDYSPSFFVRRLLPILSEFQLLWKVLDLVVVRRLLLFIAHYCYNNPVLIEVTLSSKHLFYLEVLLWLYGENIQPLLRLIMVIFPGKSTHTILVYSEAGQFVVVLFVACTSCMVTPWLCSICEANWGSCVLPQSNIPQHYFAHFMVAPITKSINLRGPFALTKEC